MNKSDLVELKYLSEAKTAMNIWDLAAILDVSANSNKRRSVTGILLYDKGYFGQILEGTRSAVEETWGRIKNDSRHHNIELLGVTEIKKRRFPEWSMRLFDAQEFSVAFPQFAELIVKIEDPDAKNLQALRSLWREV